MPNLSKQARIRTLCLVFNAAERLSNADDLQQLLATLREAFEKNEFDSYRLLLTLKNRDRLGPNVERLIDRDEVDLDYTWDKRAETGEQSQSNLPQWTLKLELIAEDKKQLGFFLLNRAYSADPLLLDVNLLTSEFQTALTRAVDRVTRTRVGGRKAAAESAGGGVAVGAAMA